MSLSTDFIFTKIAGMNRIININDISPRGFIPLCSGQGDESPWRNVVYLYQNNSHELYHLFFPTP